MSIHPKMPPACVICQGGIPSPEFVAFDVPDPKDGHPHHAAFHRVCFTRLLLEAAKRGEGAEE